MEVYARTMKAGESKPKGGCHVDNHRSRNLPDLGCDPESAGYPWSTVIMRPLIGLGALMLATIFHAIAFVAFGIALLCALTRRAV